MQSSTKWNNTLLTQRRNRARSVLLMGIGYPWPVSFSQQPTQGYLPIFTSPSVVEESNLSLQRTDEAVGLARCHTTHMLKQK